MTITGQSSTAVTTQDYITFTFTFSEPIDSATFTVNTPTVTNGVKGSFTRQSTSVCTLQVAPAAGSGTMTVAVLVGAFKDVAGNANTVAAQVTQAYSVAPPIPVLPVTFDDALIDYTFTGSVTVAVVADPDTTQVTNKVAKLSIAANAGGWPGATVQLGTAVPVGTSGIAMRVYSPGPGHWVDLKVEGDAGNTGDVLAKTTAAANKWETLVFRFPPLKSALNKITIIPHFEASGLPAANPAEDLYIDGINFPLDSPITFETFATAGAYVPESQRFPSDSGGPPALAIVDDPHLATGAPANKVLKITRAATMQVWAGFFFAPSQVIPGNTTKVSMRVWSTAPGINFNVKLEGDNGQTGDVKVATTKTNEWETMLWDYTVACNGSACGSLASSHSKITVIPDHSSAATATAGDYFIDDLKIFGSLPLDFEAPISMDGSFPSDAGQTPPLAVRVQDPTNKGNNTVLLIRRYASAANWAGVWFALGTGAVPANTTKLSMRVLSPGAGVKYNLKLEGNGGTGDVFATTTAAANTWEKLVFDYTGKDSVANAHPQVTIIPDFDGDGAGHAKDEDLYVDDIQIEP